MSPARRLSLEVELAPGRRERVTGTSVDDLARTLAARAAGQHALHVEHATVERGLRGCLVCGHPELYTQKDFHRLLGLALVVVAALLAPATRYLSLVVAALVDLALYHVAASMVVCYACGARHRGFAERPRHPRFDRTIEERLRYGERAVMGSPMREGGTADAPEPEH